MSNGVKQGAHGARIAGFDVTTTTPLIFVLVKKFSVCHTPMDARVAR